MRCLKYKDWETSAYISVERVHPTKFEFKQLPTQKKISCHIW